MELELTQLKKNYNIAEYGSKKLQLEESLSLATSGGGGSRQGSISEISSELYYYTQIFDLVTMLNKRIDDLEQSESIIATESDAELLDMAHTDVDSCKSEIERLRKEITTLEIEHKLSDPDDQKSVIVEIRAGAGGDEAALFASDIFKMYSQFAIRKNWKMEIIDYSLSESGGYKEVVAQINGKNAYKLLKYESGVHRVQRIPSTEASGRIHTSTASVAVLPEAKDIDIVIDPSEIRIDVMRASGAGGQCVNRTDSAVRITHIPTGIVVSCQETKHQAQNKEKAMTLLRSRLYEKKRAEEHNKRDSMRLSQIGAAMRAEKIRTYNYPQSRITDHRIKQSWFNLEEIMHGNLDEVINNTRQELLELQLSEINRTEKLKNE